MFYLLAVAHLFALIFAQNCTLSYYGWLSTPTLIANRTLCGVTYQQLLAMDAARLTQPQNAPWLLTAHQYCCAQMNRDRLSNVTDTIQQALFVVSDSLERTCSNMSQWQLTGSLSHAVTLLFDFNEGNLAEPCPVTRLDLNVTLYYYQPPDTIALLLPNNSTTIYSLLPGLYSNNLFMLIAIGTLLMLIGVAIGYGVIRYTKRGCTCFKRPYQEPQPTTLQELEVMEEKEQ